MKVKTLLLILLFNTANTSYADDESSLYPMPSTPSADKQFLLRYKWDPRGCDGDVTINEDGTNYRSVQIGNTIKVYFNLHSMSCWSPPAPNEMFTRDFTLDGLESGTYTLQLFSTFGEELPPLPDPNDLDSLLAETTFSVSGVNQEVALKPDDGMWVTEHNPSPGSGITFLTYKNITMVTIYTYDQDGNQQWFNGEGVIDDNNKLDILIHEATDGSPIGNNRSIAGTITSSKNLRISFYGNNIASFSLDDSLPKTIFPLYFGISGWNLPATSNHQSFAQMLPDLQGDWILYAYDTNSQQIVNDSVKHYSFSEMTEVDAVIGTHTNNIPEAYWTTEDDERLTCLLDLTLDDQVNEIHDYGCVLSDSSDEVIIIPVAELTQAAMTGYKGLVIDTAGMADDYRLTDNDSIVYHFKRLK